MAPKYVKGWGDARGTPLEWTYCLGRNCTKIGVGCEGGRWKLGGGGTHVEHTYQQKNMYIVWSISKQFLSTHSPSSQGHPLHIQTEGNIWHGI